MSLCVPTITPFINQFYLLCECFRISLPCTCRLSCPSSYLSSSIDRLALRIPTPSDVSVLVEKFDELKTGINTIVEQTRSKKVIQEELLTIQEDTIVPVNWGATHERNFLRV